MAKEASPKTGRRGWSEEEKVALLFSIIDHHVGPIKWNEIPIPPGRTIKSCTHVIAKLRNIAKSANIQGNGSGGGGENGGSLTPQSNPRKRKEPATSSKKVVGDENGQPETPPPRKKRVANPKTPKNVAPEHSDDEEHGSPGKKGVKKEEDEEDAQAGAPKMKVKAEPGDEKEDLA